MTESLTRETYREFSAAQIEHAIAKRLPVSLGYTTMGARVGLVMIAVNANQFSTDRAGTEGACTLLNSARVAELSRAGKSGAEIFDRAWQGMPRWAQDACPLAG